MTGRPRRTTIDRRRWPVLLVTAALALAGCTTGAAASAPPGTTAPGASSTTSPPGTTAARSPSPTSTTPASPAEPSTTAPPSPATVPPSPSSSASSASAPPSPSASPSPSTPSPSTSPSTAPAPSTDPPAAETDQLRRGDSGPQVRQAQERLAALGYWLGQVDGNYGPLTRQAVLALQGAAGLDRDGVLGPRTRRALDAGTLPSVTTGSGHAVEIDRDAGLVVIADDGRPTTVLHTSTGTFEHYVRDGRRFLADTPAGTFDVYRSVDDWDGGPLGDLYRPRYFQRDGIAVHGYPNVPAYPASHGCARVSMAAMDMIWADDLMAIGTPVVVR